MEHIGTNTIETERLILRRFVLSDAKDMFDNYASRDSVTKFLTWKSYQNVEDVKSYLKNVVIPSYKAKDRYNWAIVLKSTNKVVGCIDVVQSEEKHRRAELGWVLGDDYWGQGIMPEAAKAVVKYLFDIGFERIQAKHVPDNPKSGRVMEKIGMTKEGTLKKYFANSDKELVDCIMWAIVK